MSDSEKHAQPNVKANLTSATLVFQDKRETSFATSDADAEMHPDAHVCARCHRPVDYDDRCDNDAHNWYPRPQRFVMYSDVLGGTEKVIDPVL
jgi:hypothetical protein